MRFNDIYKNKTFRFSVEVFPPKTEKGLAKIYDELTALKAINPAYVSVTYGAMGSTRSLTQDIALKIHDDLKLNTAFHFTCVGSGKEEIKKYVNTLRERGINNIVALRGDRPQDPDYKKPEDGFSYANELVSYLSEIGDFSIAVAGYPEKHIEAQSIDEDIENLKRKVESGAEVIITQLFFDNQLFYEWLAKIRSKGISVPIIPGIMPILKLAQIERITNMCGANLPKELIRRLEKCGGDEEKMRLVGVDHAASQCQDLIQNNVSGVHFYCLNRADSVLAIVDKCRHLLTT